MVKEEEGLNLEALEVKPAELKPVPRGKAPQPNPLIEQIQKTWDTGEALGVEVPVAQALAVGAKLRKSAMKIGLGVSVQYHLLPEDEYRSENAVKELKEDDPGHMIRVAFQAHELVKAARHEQDDETDN